ncbi:MAG: pyruvate dehydrogenase complex E1 component subunit beta [Aromatoleum sp.]|jgi:pyruvate dehydrogenase E1 component beta subunit|uniref:alpha-ketoacid dehydrogenase subunit beta n=1 Tax=Aromatoleum sp. TaxID=2307007 RepID=UPI00289573CA|nr:pyruvate dehydrogenase complex E1 component subunit beta [Aromatoleum sp.]MDT3670998.1 pyruvate dehydrogenase complex E1 component subunit beta [Aromatoleum sp.]
MSTVAQKKINTAQAINLALHDAMAFDSSVVVLGEDIADAQGGGVFKCTAGLSQKFGTGRVKSTPISEQAIVGAAVGGALAGLRPVAEIMLMNFMTVAMDQIVNHAAKLRFMTGGQTHVPLVIRTTTGAGFGTGGQHADYLEAWFAHTAGIKVVAPATPADAYGLLLSCIFDDDPCIFIENLPLYFVPGDAPVPGERVPIGKAKVVQEGSDITLVSYSRTLHDVIAVAKKLAKEGVSAEVIDLRTIAPLDMQTVTASARKTGRVVVAHEAQVDFGVGAEIAARLHKDLFGTLKAPVARVGAARSPVPFSKPLETEFVPTQNRILAAIRETLN